MIWECMYTSSGSSASEESACNAGDPGRFLGQEDSLEKEMATHSSILTWKTPCTEEPGGLQSMGSQSWLSNWAWSIYIINWNLLCLLCVVKDDNFCVIVIMSLSLGFSSSLLCQSVQFSHSVMSNSVTPWTTAHQASLSITNSWSLTKQRSKPGFLLA